MGHGSGRRLAAALLVAGLGGLILGCGPSPTATASPPTSTPTPGFPTASVKGITFRLELALTAAERALGLGYRPSLPSDQGMLFVLDSEHIPAFWMKGMEFSIDILWISGEGRVVDITHRAPPEPGVPDQALARYLPRAPVAYVLEINAGLARRYGSASGDAVTFRGLPEPGA